jgi:hypothetical protein
MQDLIVALYDDHAAATAVRTALVSDGFATDRVEVTSPTEHRQADKGPSASLRRNIEDYFYTLSADEEAARRMSRFASAVLGGAATVTVHPRGEEEIRRCEQILATRAPREVYRYLPDDAGHALDRKIERAATPPHN